MRLGSLHDLVPRNVLTRDDLPRALNAMCKFNSPIKHKQIHKITIIVDCKSLRKKLIEYTRGIYGAIQGLSCVTCHSFCSCFVTCSIVPNVAVAFEQKLKLYVGLVMLHAVCCCWQIVAIFLIISVTCQHFENGLSPHFQIVSPVTLNPGRVPDFIGILPIFWCNFNIIRLQIFTKLSKNQVP